MNSVVIGNKEDVSTFANRIQVIADQVNHRVKQEAAQNGTNSADISPKYMLSYLTSGLSKNQYRFNDLKGQLAIARADKKSYDETLQYLVSEEIRQKSICNIELAPIVINSIEQIRMSS
jgi:hypothetical protein